MINKIIYFLFIIFFSSLLHANSIAVINIEFLINNYENYKKIQIKIDNEYNSLIKSLENKEKELETMMNEIEESKNILSENDINILIQDYNLNLQNLQIEINKINTHFENEIIKIRKKILDEIMILVEKFINDNNISLIFDSTNYLMASNNLNITEKIANDLGNIDLNLKYNEFK